MEYSPLLLEPEFRPVSQTGSEEDCFDFQFPKITNTGAALPNDIVFCGKVITHQTRTEPDPSRKRRKTPSSLRSQSFSKVKSGPCISSQEKRSESFRWPGIGGNRKHNNGLFGIVKYPSTMELSEIKERQSRKEPVPLPKFKVGEGGELVVVDGGKGNRWELVRPMRRRHVLMNAFVKAWFGCIPVV